MVIIRKPTPGTNYYSVNPSLLDLMLSVPRLLPRALLLLPTNPSPRFSNFPHKHHFSTTTMEGKRGNRSDNSIKSNPKVGKMQGLLDRDSEGGWDECWEQGLTPWDLGKPTPVLLHLLQSEALPKGRVLVPGCGSGHDVTAIASSERYVVGLDLSNNAIKIARELPVSSPNANHFEFIEADFFTWHSTELFDLIFDYTFFCAIEPCKRSFWARRVQELLKPDGELITLMFPISDHSGGPPYKVSVTDYEEVLHPVGFKAISVIDNELAIEPRRGKEKLGRWKRSLNRSLL